MISKRSSATLPLSCWVSVDNFPPTGPIGRIVAEDALRSVEGAKKSNPRGKLITSADDFADNLNGLLAISPADVSMGYHTDARPIDGPGENFSLIEFFY